MNLTTLLIAINVIAFVWETVSAGGLKMLTGDVTNEFLFDHGALVGLAATQYGQWWRIVTAAFLHGSLIHIAMNMFALSQVGTVCEWLFGRTRYALVYAIALVGAGVAIAYFAPRDVTVGASGAIFGLFGALVAAGLRLGARGRQLVGQVVPVIGLNLIITFTIPNISVAGHVGGLITGFLAGYVLFTMPSRQRDKAYAYAFPESAEPAAGETIEQDARAEPQA